MHGQSVDWISVLSLSVWCLWYHMTDTDSFEVIILKAVFLNSKEWEWVMVQDLMSLTPPPPNDYLTIYLPLPNRGSVTSISHCVFMWEKFTVLMNLSRSVHSRMQSTVPSVGHLAAILVSSQSGFLTHVMKCFQQWISWKVTQRSLLCSPASDARERQHWVDRLRSTAEYHTANIAQVSLFK